MGCRAMRSANCTWADSRAKREATPGSEVLIDTHAARGDGAAWALYACAIGRFGRRPVDRMDNEIPALATLLERLGAPAAIAASRMTSR
jgi:uncharacterized protein (UPF0276 family)